MKMSMEVQLGLLVLDLFLYHRDKALPDFLQYNSFLLALTFVPGLGWRDKSCLSVESRFRRAFRF